MSRSERAPHIIQFPDGGVGCLRCAAASPEPHHQDLRRLAVEIYAFFNAHENCTGNAGPVPVEVASAFLLAGKVGAA